MTRLLRSPVYLPCRHQRLRIQLDDSYYRRCATCRRAWRFDLELSETAKRLTGDDIYRVLFTEVRTRNTPEAVSA